ncbi:cell division protein FtsQ/DivIB [Taylorella equigenitalis]|uniref:cell division protein FtsQ/DivIB n=1 Tax=Taylorella equigenitalis TaxID=29575 RepID=UPI00042A7E0C|nr:cell division protein FtsQ/DivIB [Taylorella equigenitalis]WDU47593.1 cell division protein FtsQ/DivIB [Taylorella equigenitalis]
MLGITRLLNFIANLIMTISVFALLVGGGYYLINRPYFNISQVSLLPSRGNALNHISPASIQATINSGIDGNFFTADLNTLKEKVEALPWVRSVEINRVWPNRLVLTIEEHEAYAKWNEDMLLNTWGELFNGNRDELPEDIAYPQYYGPEGSEKLVVQRAGELATLISPLNMSIKEMHLSDRYAWNVILDNGIELVLGRDGGAELVDPYGGQQQAINFAQNVNRFVSTWPLLLDRINDRKISKIDFRYTKGFAVTFTPEIIPEETDKK